jgi:hypothetical protein
MRYRTLILIAWAAAAVAGCDKESDKPKPQAAAPAPAVSPDPTPPAPRVPGSDLKEIQGKWETTGKAPIQIEFAGDTMVFRSGPGPEWKETGRYPVKLNDLARIREIDWGEGPQAGHGLYTIDGKVLVITYTTGRPEDRPKRLDAKPGTATILDLRRAK